MWQTPITDRTISDVNYLKSLQSIIGSAGWDNASGTDKYFWLYGDVTPYQLVGNGDPIFTSALELLSVHGEAVPIKGAWNFEDANRVIQNSSFLRDLLLLYGYVATFSDQTLLTESSLPHFTSVHSLYKENVQKLLDAFPDFGGPVLNTDNYFDYEDANDLELNLKLLYDYIQNVIATFKRCGTFSCGQSISL